MDPELLVPEISTSQAWWTDQLLSENQRRSPTKWSHLTHSLHYFHWWHLWTAVIPCPMGAACRQPSVMDQSRASDHHSHQDAGSNESHLRLGKKVVGNDQQNQDWSHLLLPVFQERRVHPADQWTRNPPARHPNVPGAKLENWPDFPTSVQCTAKISGKWPWWRNWLEQNVELTWYFFYPGLHCNCQTPHGLMKYASNAWSSAASTNLDQL